MQGVIGGPSVTFNPYPYAQNNPVNMVDPNGEFALPVAIALLASTWAWNREVTANRAEGLTGWDAFSIDNVNIRPIIEPWAMLGAGYVGGAAIGALGFTGRTALAASAVTDIGASYLWNTQVNGSYSTTDLLFDAVFFGMGEYIGYRGVRNGRNSTAQSPSATSSANIIRTERPRGVDPGRSLRMRRTWHSNTNSPHQIDYGASDLSREVIEYRRSRNFFQKRNVAVYEYIDNSDEVQTLTMASDRFGVEGTTNRGHAERRIWRELEKRGVDPSRVTRIYSELEPCSTPTEASGCGRFIQKTFPNVIVTYSFEYGTTQASRRAGRAAWKDALDRLFGN